MEGSISLLLLTDVTKSIKRTDAQEGALEAAGSVQRPRGFSRLIREHHSLAVVAGYTRGERVIMMPVDCAHDDDNNNNGRPTISQPHT